MRVSFESFALPEQQELREADLLDSVRQFNREPELVRPELAERTLQATRDNMRRCT